MKKEIYCHLGAKGYEINKFRVPKNFRGHNKPQGGLWACPYRLSPFEGNVYRTDWEIYFRKEYGHTYGKEESFLFTVSDSARRYIVESVLDYHNIPFLQADGSIDWERMASQYDTFEVVNLIYDPEAGSDAPYWRRLPFWDWNVPSLVVLNPNVVEPVEEKSNLSDEETFALFNQVLFGFFEEMGQPVL